MIYVSYWHFFEFCLKNALICVLPEVETTLFFRFILGVIFLVAEAIVFWPPANIRIFRMFYKHASSRVNLKKTFSAFSVVFPDPVQKYPSLIKSAILSYLHLSTYNVDVWYLDVAKFWKCTEVDLLLVIWTSSTVCRLNGSVSDWSEVTPGVPQGSVLGSTCSQRSSQSRWWFCVQIAENRNIESHNWKLNWLWFSQSPSKVGWQV